jgi:hypothetical protein
MERTASTIAAALLTVWALAGITQQQQQQPAAAQPAAPRVTAPAAASALGDHRTLSRYPGP